MKIRSAMNNRMQSVTYNIDRQKEDFYASDPKTINALLSVEDFSDIWECAAGSGHMTKRLEELGKQVYSSDLVDRGAGYDLINFLITDKQWSGDFITNPPYKHAQAFIEKTLTLLKPGRKAAFLLRLLFVESGKRKKLFATTPPKTIYIFSNRVECFKDAAPDYAFNGGSVTCYAWFVWQGGYKGKTTLEWI